MVLKKTALSAVLSFPALTVLAQGFVPIPSDRNATSPAPTSTDPACENRCSVQYPSLTAIQWIPASQVIYTTTVVVATVSVIYTTVGNETYPPRTQTLYQPVGPEYNLYSLGANEGGTVVLTASVGESKAFTTWATLTYPTPYLDYFTELHWQGVLQTREKASNILCATATLEPANAPLNNHPQYPQPTDVSPGNIDPLGTEHVPIWAPVQDNPDKGFFDAAFPSQSAFSFCESVPAAVPLPTQYLAPKYETVTTTVYTKSTGPPGVVIIQPSATGWDREPSHPPVGPVAHIESSTDGFGNPSTITRTPPVGTSQVAARIELTTSGWGNPNGPQAQQSGSPGDIGNNSPPSNENDNPGSNEQYQPAPSPVFTYVPTVIDGRTTSVPAYILPGSSSTASIGQTVTVNGQPTVLRTPAAIFTSVPVRIGPAPTSSPAYIISGSITATIGQTVTIDGTTTVLSLPTNSGANSGGAGGPKETARPNNSNTPKGTAASSNRIPWRALITLCFAMVLRVR